MKASLTITGGPQLDRRWTIESGKPLTFGRSDQADAVLLDAEVSRVHCRVAFEDNHWTIEDNDSMNGLFVNGKKVDKCRLQQGDSIRLGGVTLRFEVGSGEAAEKAPATAAPRETAAEPKTEPKPHRPRDWEYMAPRTRRIEKETTVDQFLARHPDDASNIVLSRVQKLWYVFLLAALTLLLLYDYLYFLHFIHLLCTFYLVVIGYKVVTILLSFVRRWEIRASDAAIAELKDEELPVYTILVPLYREPEVVNKVVAHIADMDYPSGKLDVKILLEPDDDQTLAAIRRTGLPEFCEVIICPDSQPRTKPKACNHGLAQARGEHVVIYDAEDRPDTDQLKKAVIGFRQAEERWNRLRWLRRINPLQRADAGRTVCLQAKLNYYNPRQNLLTRWFAIEYATWFQLYLPGLHALRAPIPLGGTSNHFHTDVLRRIGGWDPFNVTEDCDLGIRLHKLGYRTRILDTTTWEEANSKVGNWIRQRSRWVKGYIQTHFTHMRHPLRTLWQLRPLGMFHFLNAVGGLSLMLLLNPIFWAASLLYVGLFAADLHEHGYSVGRAVGVQQAISDATDVEVRRDRTIRLPHPSRWAWPMICIVRRQDVRQDAHWATIIWKGIKEDWRQAWLGLRDGSAGPDAGGGGPPAPAGEVWTEKGFHFWNVVSQVFFLFTVALVLGNALFVLIHVLACFRAGFPELIPYALISPLYWVLISLAAWKGFLQLFWKPFFWEKTRHGLDVKAAVST
jgi:cellulose synthase/poly-beta-1,6-N-acetylglucosamine synthase-like glycosyltransferase